MVNELIEEQRRLRNNRIYNIVESAYMEEPWKELAVILKYRSSPTENSISCGLWANKTCPDDQWLESDVNDNIKMDIVSMKTFIDSLSKTK